MYFKHIIRYYDWGRKAGWNLYQCIAKVEAIKAKNKKAIIDEDFSFVSKGIAKKIIK